MRKDLNIYLFTYLLAISIILVLSLPQVKDDGTTAEKRKLSQF